MGQSNSRVGGGHHHHHHHHHHESLDGSDATPQPDVGATNDPEGNEHKRHHGHGQQPDSGVPAS